MSDLFGTPAPIETREDGTPVFDGGQISASLLMAKLIDRQSDWPVPCWIKCGNSSTKVTNETRYIFARGMLLALEMQEAKENK